MNGISIYRKNPYKNTDTCTAFEINFKSIFDKLEDYFWCIPDMIFRFPDSWYYGEYDSEKDLHKNKEWDYYWSFYINSIGDRLFENMVVKPSYIQKFSKYFVDDWCDIYGFEEKYINDFINLKNMKSIKPMFIDNKIPIYFGNVDAAYWDFYTSNNELLETLKTNLKNDDDCKIVERLFNVKDAKFIW